MTVINRIELKGGKRARGKMNLIRITAAEAAARADSAKAHAEAVLIDVETHGEG